MLRRAEALLLTGHHPPASPPLAPPPLASPLVASPLAASPRLTSPASAASAAADEAGRGTGYRGTGYSPGAADEAAAEAAPETDTAVQGLEEAQGLEEIQGLEEVQGLEEAALAAHDLAAAQGQAVEQAAAQGLGPAQAEEQLRGVKGLRGVNAQAEEQLLLQGTGYRAQAEEQLRVASDVLRECSGSNNILRIGPNTQPPPRLSGRSCVYLLQLGSKGQGAADDALYVGESDSIDRRLQQHRRTHSERRLECVLVEVASKSTALEVEALAIRRLKALRVGHVINIVHA